MACVVVAAAEDATASMMTVRVEVAERPLWSVAAWAMVSVVAGSSAASKRRWRQWRSGIVIIEAFIGIVLTMWHNENKTVDFIHDVLDGKHTVAELRAHVEERVNGAFEAGMSTAYIIVRNLLVFLIAIGLVIFALVHFL